MVYVRGLFIFLLSNGTLSFLDRRLKSVNIRVDISRIERISSSDEMLLCMGTGGLSLFHITGTTIKQVANIPLQAKYDLCHVTRQGDFILLSSGNVVECYGIQYTGTRTDMNVSIIPLARDDECISYGQYATCISSCYDEVSKKTYFLVSDSDCQLSVIGLNIDMTNKTFSLELAMTEVLESSADFIASACNIFSEHADRSCDGVDTMKHMIISSTDVAFVDSKGRRTHRAESLKAAYLVGVWHSVRPDWQEFGAAEQEGEGTSGRIVLYMETGGRLVQTRELIARPEGDKAAGLGYGRPQSQAPVNQCEAMDGGQLSGVGDVLAVEGPGGDCLVTRRDEGVALWERQ